MILDLDIWRAASAIIKQYGEDAPIHATYQHGDAFARVESI